ncbi:hypothetical protein Tco_0061545 [Tanacetum coccineum]
MTKISDVEANLEQFKSETLASQEETRNLSGQMQESIDRNKVSSGGIFQNYRDAGGIFANTTVHPITTVHGTERGWQSGSRDLITVGRAQATLATLFPAFTKWQFAGAVFPY